MNLMHPILALDGPLVMTIPGEARGGFARRLANRHAGSGNVRPLELGMWDNPHRNTWVNKLNLAIHKTDEPLFLLAEGLACLAVAWWAEYEQPVYAEPVLGAAFVSLPDVDRPGRDPRVARLGSGLHQALPFPVLVVASGREGPDLLRTYRRLAGEWGGSFVASPSFFREDGSLAMPAAHEISHLLNQLAAVRSLRMDSAAS